MPDIAEDPRDVSRALFGNGAFAEVAGAADAVLSAGGPSATVTTRQVAASTGLADSVVRPVMHRLVTAGLLSARKKRGPVNGAQPFERARPERWLPLLELVGDMDSDHLRESGVAGS